MSVITYSLTNNFNSYILSDVLKQQIDDEIGINTNCLSVLVDGSLVNITFDGILTTNEKNLLDNVINNHHEAYSNMSFENNNIYLITVPVKVRASSFEEIATFSYSGIIKSILIIAKGTDYTIRLYDLTNLLVMYEQDFTNTNYEEITVSESNISNIPRSEALISVQLRTNVVKNTFIKLFQVNT